MKFKLLILLFIKANILCAQYNQSDSLDYYISHLNWNTATVAPTYFPQIALNDLGQKLVSAKDKSIEQKLYERISDTEKTLAIYIILTNRHKYRVSLLEKGHYKNDDSTNVYNIEHYKKDPLIGMFYTYNNLNWYYDLNSGNSTITPDAVIYAQQYWKNRIKKKKVKK